VCVSGCRVCWVSGLLGVGFVGCRVCWVSGLLGVGFVGCRVCWVSGLLGVGFWVLGFGFRVYGSGLGADRHDRVQRFEQRVGLELLEREGDACWFPVFAQHHVQHLDVHLLAPTVWSAGAAGGGGSQRHQGHGW